MTLTRWAAITGMALSFAGCVPTYCDDSCSLARDGECDDGRFAAATGLCAPGTDCGDCGPNFDTAPPPTPGAPAGSNYFGQPARGRAPIPIPGCTPEPPGVGWYCVEANVTEQELCFGSAPCLSDGVSRAFYYQGECASSIPSYCGDGRHCLSVGTGTGLAALSAVGCLLDGASLLTDRVVTCETVGYCDNGVELRWCSDVPALLPIPPNWQMQDISYWYEMGSLRHVYQERSAPVPQPDTFVFGTQDHNWCVTNGGMRFCGTTPCPADTPVGPSDECRRLVGDLRLPSSGNSCFDACTRNFVDCAYANNCQAIDACQTRYNSCWMPCL